MRAVLQRVHHASVSIDETIVGEINTGLVVLLGVGQEDSDEDLDWLLTKICNLRIFENDSGKFDKSLIDIHGEILLVSQFTLFADCRKGRRPGFDRAASPELGNNYYKKAIAWLQKRDIPVQTGKFGAMMNVNLTNHGPVTIIIDSKDR